MKISKKKILLIAVSVLVVALLAAFIFRFALFSGIIKKQAFSVLGNLLHVQVLSGEISGELLGDVSLTNVSFKPLEKSFFTGQVNIRKVNAKFSIWGLIAGKSDWFKEAVMEGANIPVDGNKLEAFYKEMQGKQKSAGPGRKIKPPKIRLSGISLKAVYNNIEVRVDDFDLAFDTHKDLISALADTSKISLKLPQVYEEILNLKTTAEEKEKMIFLVKYIFEMNKQSANVDINLNLSGLEKENVILFQTDSNIFGGKANITGKVLTKAEAGKTPAGTTAGLELRVQFDGISVPEKYLQGHKMSRIAGDIQVFWPDFKLENLKISGTVNLLEPFVFDGYQVDLLRVEELEFSPGAMQVRGVIYAGAYGCEIRCTGMADLKGKSFTADISGIIPNAGTLKRFAGDKDVYGRIDFKARTEGKLDSIPDSLTVVSEFSASDVGLGQYLLSSVKGTASLSKNIVTLHGISVKPMENFDGNIQFNGTFKLDDSTLHLSADGDIADLSSFDRLAGDRHLAGSMVFNADVAVDLDDIKGSLAAGVKFALKDAGLVGYTCKAVNGDILIADKIIHIKEISGRLMNDNNDSFNCSGEFNIDDGSIDIAVGGYVKDLNLARDMIRKIAGDLPLAGSVDTYTTVTGNINSGINGLKIDTIFTGREIAFDNYRCDLIKGQAELESGNIRIEDVSLEHRGMSCVITAEGALSGSLDAELSFNAESILQMAKEMLGMDIPADGKLEIKAHVTRVPGTGPFGSLSGKSTVKFSGGSFMLKDKKIEINTVSADISYDNGTADFCVKTAGPSTVETYMTGSVEVNDPLNPAKVMDSPIDMSFSASGITEEFLRNFVQLPADVRFNLSTDIQVSGRPANPEIKCGFSVGDAVFSIGGEIKQLQPVNGVIEYRDGVITVEPFKIISDYGTIAVSGNVPYTPAFLPDSNAVSESDTPTNFSVEISDLNMEVLQDKFLKNKISFNELKILPKIYVNLSGTLAKASITGGLDVDNGRFALNEKTPPVEDIDVHLRFSAEAPFEELTRGFTDASVEIHTRVLMGKEPVSVDGTVKAVKGFWDGSLHKEKISFDFRAYSARALLVSEYLIRVRAGFDMQIAGTPADACVRGDVAVDTFRFEVPLDSGASGPEQKNRKRSKKPVPVVMHFVPPMAGMDWLKYDINVRASDNMHLMNQFFDGVAGCDLKIGGTAAVPEVAGEAWLKEGIIKNPLTSDFTIEECKINFPGGEMPPMIKMISKGKIGLVNVTIAVNGTIFDPKPILSSDPFYSQEDLLSLVAVGVVKPRSSTGSGMIISSSQFTNWLNRKVVKPISGNKEIANILEKINFECEFKAGVSQPIIRAEYPISTRFSIYGERDEYSNFNFDLQYIFRLKF